MFGNGGFDDDTVLFQHGLLRRILRIPAAKDQEHTAGKATAQHGNDQRTRDKLAKAELLAFARNSGLIVRLILLPRGIRRALLLILILVPFVFHTHYSFRKEMIL